MIILRPDAYHTLWAIVEVVTYKSVSLFARPAMKRLVGM